MVEEVLGGGWARGLAAQAPSLLVVGGSRRKTSYTKPLLARATVLRRGVERVENLSTWAPEAGSAKR